MKVDPRYLSFMEWADRVVDSTNYGIPKATRVNWKEWATSVLEVPSIASQLPPRPEEYSDWRVWAEDFNRAVEL